MSTMQLAMLVRLTFPKSLTGAAEKDLIAVAFIAAFAGILIVERIIVEFSWMWKRLCETA